MASSPTGGGNATAVWAYSSGGMTGITGITATSYMLFNRNESSTITGDPRVDELRLELTSKIRNNLFVLFKDAVLTRVNIANNTQTYEDGTEESFVNVPSTAIRLCVVHTDGSLDSKRIVTAFVGLMDSAAVGSSRTSGTLGDTNVSFVAIPAPQATTLSSAMIYLALSPQLATGFTDIVIPSGKYGKEVLITAA